MVDLIRRNYMADAGDNAEQGDGKRAITTMMERNKGLVRHKKKEARNPRIARKLKYAKVHFKVVSTQFTCRRRKNVRLLFRRCETKLYDMVVKRPVFKRIQCDLERSSPDIPLL